VVELPRPQRKGSDGETAVFGDYKGRGQRNLAVGARVADWMADADTVLCVGISDACLSLVIESIPANNNKL